MVSMNLTDTGKYDTAQSYQTDAQVTSEEKAYGSAGTEGTALNLNIHEVSINEEPLVNDEVALQNKEDNSSTKRFEVGELDMVGVNYNLWTLKGTFDSTSTDSMKDYGRLMHMCKTKGYKELRFLNTATKEKAMILNYCKYGEREYDSETTKTVGDADTPINGRIVGKTFGQKLMSGYKITFTIKFLETN